MGSELLNTEAEVAEPGVTAAGQQQDIATLPRGWGPGLGDVCCGLIQPGACHPRHHRVRTWSPAQHRLFWLHPVPSQPWGQELLRRAVGPRARVGLPRVAAGLGLRPRSKPSRRTATGDFGGPAQAERTGCWKSRCWGSAGTGARWGLAALPRKAQALPQVPCSGLWSHVLCS